MTSPAVATERFRTATARRVIGILAALALAGGLAAGPAVAASASSARTGSASASTTRSAAASFVASLNPAQSTALGAGLANVPHTGLRLGDLTATQQSAALALLRSLLSTAAWAGLRDLMTADAALDASAGGGSEWAVGDYHLALFGHPDDDFVLQFSTSSVILTAMRQGEQLDVRPDILG